MAAAMGIGRFVYTPLLPEMIEQLPLSAADAGLIASANFLGYLVGAFAASGGWAAGRERKILLAGLVASALLAAAMGMTTSLTLFVAIRFLAGLASAFVMVFLASIVLGRLAAAGRSDLQALHFAGVGVGMALSSLLMLALGRSDAGWQQGWYWAAVLSAFGVAGVIALLADAPPSPGAAAREPGLPTGGDFLRIVVAYGLFGFGYVITATFLIAIVRAGGNALEATLLLEGIVWLVAGLAAIPSVYLWSRLTARAGPARTFATASVVLALGVGASVSIGGAVGPVLAGLMLGGTFMALTAIGLQIGRMLAPSAPRRAFAVMTGAFGVGQIVGPLFAGWLAERSGSYLFASMTAAAALLVAAAVAWPIARNSPRLS